MTPSCCPQRSTSAPSRPSVDQENSHIHWKRALLLKGINLSSIQSTSLPLSLSLSLFFLHNQHVYLRISPSQITSPSLKWDFNYPETNLKILRVSFTFPPIAPSPALPSQSRFWSWTDNMLSYLRRGQVSLSWACLFRTENSEYGFWAKSSTLTTFVRPVS